jgi:uncharacterized protein (TIGR03435 family)
MENIWRFITILLLSGCCASAQSFEVASIRLHNGRVQSVSSRFVGDRFIGEALSADNLISFAYDLKSYQVFGAPRWADSKNLDCDRYDVNGKAEGGVTLNRDQARVMLQNLLADRFQLKFHREMREMPIYALVVARSGHKLKESSPDAQSMGRMRSAGKGAELSVTKGTMAQLALQFSGGNGVDRPVIDRTELSGNYDYTLTWAPGLAPGADTDAVDVYTAFQEQLGLRLEPSRAAIEVLVIDHLEKPSEN